MKPNCPAQRTTQTDSIKPPELPIFTTSSKQTLKSTRGWWIIWISSNQTQQIIEKIPSQKLRKKLKHMIISCRICRFNQTVDCTEIKVVWLNSTAIRTHTQYLEHSKFSECVTLDYEIGLTAAATWSWWAFDYQGKDLNEKKTCITPIDVSTQTGQMWNKWTHTHTQTQEPPSWAPRPRTPIRICNGEIALAK